MLESVAGQINKSIPQTLLKGCDITLTRQGKGERVMVKMPRFYLANDS